MILAGDQVTGGVYEDSDRRLYHCPPLGIPGPGPGPGSIAMLWGFPMEVPPGQVTRGLRASAPRDRYHVVPASYASNARSQEVSGGLACDHLLCNSFHQPTATISAKHPTSQPRSTG
jgi:hypothetical protein